MKKVIILIFLIFINLKSFSQKAFSAEVLTGMGFNKEISLLNENIEKKSPN